ncbi:MAG: hypothetical protein NWE88_09080 [Candidatus Bathyarchaeota archaeon]|nr:hypothetical protein [Candidatus Bathyarchaeota archaeon]
MSAEAARRRALAQVVTTLILLVVSILLSGVVVYYSVNLISTRVQTEEIRLSKQHVWVNSTGAVGAFRVENLGGRDILIDKMEVRGVESGWSNVYYYRVPSGTTIGGDFNVTSYSNLIGAGVTIDGKNYTQASSDIPLMSGGELLIYVKGPGNVDVNDIGTTVSFSVFTGLSQYITECNVESAT